MVPFCGGPHRQCTGNLYRRFTYMLDSLIQGEGQLEQRKTREEDETTYDDDKALDNIRLSGGYNGMMMTRP
jgi:hypothetical protein